MFYAPTLQNALPPFVTKNPGLYSADDDVEVLDKNNFMSVYSNDRAAFVEFYSHWCGACQRYSKHWKEMATLTKNWHSTVIRVAAINCADPTNSDICNAFEIMYYPTLRLIPANANYEKKEHDSKLVKTKENKLLLEEMINFLSDHETKPSNWPDLMPFTSDKFETTFTNKNQKQALLVIEPTESQLARKLILEFSSVKDKLPIKRINKESNSELYNKLKVENVPSVYSINRNGESLLFDVDNVIKFCENNPLKDGLSKSIDELRNELIKYELETEFIKIKKLIEVFVQHLAIDIDAEHISDIKDENQIGKPDISHNNQENGAYLTSTQNRVFMQDLESGLSYMLRSDIATYKFFNAEKLNALKEVLRVLVKFFPGRQPVRNYLIRLYNGIQAKKEITGQQWRLLVDYESPDTYLPSKIEWRHCKGSKDIYRGYPCSLWTIFHVLTVSQVEQEKGKQNPFTEGYNIQEVVNGIRVFVLNFFTCKDCSQHFKLETENWQNHLNEPYDAVKYIWYIHNKVNERLKNEDNNDPVYPKIQFPNKTQCSKCFKENTNANESPFIESEVIQYLTSFYSKFQIEGVMELDMKKELDEKLPTNLDAHFKNALVKQSENHLEDIKLQSEQISNSVIVNLSIFLVIITALGLVMIFYGFVKRRERIKAHII